MRARRYQAVQAAMHDVGGSTLIDSGFGNSVTLVGVQVSALHAEDFLLV